MSSLNKDKAKKLLKIFGMSQTEEVSLTLQDVASQLKDFNKVINIAPLVKSVEEVSREFGKKTAELQNLVQKKVSEIKLSIPKDQTNNLLSEIDNVGRQALEADAALSKEIKSIQSELSSSFETKIAEVFQTFSKEIQGLQSKKETDKEVKSILEALNKLRQETISRINSIGGGSANQKISVNGTVMSSRYSDFNLIPSTGVTISKADNNTTKQVDITIASSGGTSEVPTGAINGVNVTYTFVTAPSVIVVDQGRTIIPNNGYTLVGTVATLDVAPTFSIFSI